MDERFSERRNGRFISEQWQLVEQIARELRAYTTLTNVELDPRLAIYRGKQTEQDFSDYRDC